MTLRDPLYMQNLEYDADEFRQHVGETLTEGTLGPTGLAVSQRAAGANNSVDVAIGACIIDGDDQANQGAYLCVNTAVENVALGAAPGSLKRRDIIIARVNDPQAGGPAGNNWTLTYVEGTDLHASNPTAPAVPTSAILLATILRSAGDANITNAMITDGRTLAMPRQYELQLPHTWTIPGEVKVPSGDTDYILPMFVPVPSGYVAELVRLRHRLNSGTSATISVQKQSVDIAGMTGISVINSSTTTTPTTAPTFADGDRLGIVVTAVSGTPKNMSVTAFVRYRRLAA